MRACDLRDANCTGAIFSYADMRGSRMQAAIMKDSILIGTQMQGVDAQNVDFTGADMRGCNLGGAALDGAKMPQQTVSPITPADLVEGKDQAPRRDARPEGLTSPADLVAKTEAAATAAKAQFKEPPAMSAGKNSGTSRHRTRLASVTAPSSDGDGQRRPTDFPLEIGQVDVDRFVQSFDDLAVAPPLVGRVTGLILGHQFPPQAVKLHQARADPVERIGVLIGGRGQRGGQWFRIMAVE